MGVGALYYYKNVVENDEKDVKNNQYHFINKIILKNYNNLFTEIKQINQIKKNTKRKINTFVSVFWTIIINIFIEKMSFFNKNVML